MDKKLILKTYINQFDEFLDDTFYDYFQKTQIYDIVRHHLI